ncbi:MAG: hypothetical protein KDN22_14020 [Verrucomicrobiae bacterium]|nr:hypothetical protein [Verrucomicrobiae bacterium]
MIIDENDTAKPFIGECAFCGQGLLRVWIISEKLAVLCDQCELYWSDISAVANDPMVPATGTLDTSPLAEPHRAATSEEIADANLTHFISGYSV